MMPTITDPKELALALEDAASILLRWGHNQLRHLPAEEIAMIVAALRAQRTPTEVVALAEDRLDAIRYRFLRDHAVYFGWAEGISQVEIEMPDGSGKKMSDCYYTRETLDKAVDKAMQAPPSPQREKP